MSLVFTGTKFSGLHGTSLEAHDANGDRVVVVVTHEAVQDYGLARAPPAGELSF